MKWAITYQFHKYLYGKIFDVYTDNNPLTYVLSTAKLDAMGYQWVTGLANYNFHNHYKSGKSNVEVDALSMIDWEKCDETLQANSIQAIVAAATARDVANIEAVSFSVQTNESFLPISSDTIAISKPITRSSNQSHTTFSEHESSMLKTVSKVDNSDHPALAFRWSGDKLKPKCMTKQDWVEAQSKDKSSGKIIHLFKSKKLYCCKINEIDKNKMKQFIRECNRLFMRNGILYNKSEENHPDRRSMQLVFPETLRKQALQGCHNDLGHLRIEWMIDQ